MSSTSASKLTQAALRSPQLPNLLLSWLAHINRRYEPSTSPTDLFELGHFITHPALIWSYAIRNQTQALSPILLLVLPWNGASLFFGPLAAENNQGICPVARSLLSDRSRRVLDRQIFHATNHPVWVFGYHTATDACLEVLDRHTPAGDLPKATTTDQTLQLPSFCFQTLSTTIHLLQGPHVLQEKPATAPDELWNQEPSLDINDWKATIQIAQANSTDYHAKLTYSHPTLGTMAPIGLTRAVKTSDTTGTTQRFNTVLAVLKEKFSILFNITNQALDHAKSNHPRTSVSTHNNGTALHVPCPFPGQPPLIIRLSLKEIPIYHHKKLHLVIDVICNYPAMPPPYRKQQYTYLLSATTPFSAPLPIEVIQAATDAYHNAILASISC